jgi:hypothetical protein
MHHAQIAWMSIKSRLRGVEKQQVKREKRKAKIEEREERRDFPPLVLMGILAVGSLVALMPIPLWFLFLIVPLVTRNMATWDFWTSLKVGAMISIVTFITRLVFYLSEIGIVDLLMYFGYSLAIITLLLYTGSFLVALFQGKGVEKKAPGKKKKK